MFVRKLASKSSNLSKKSKAGYPIIHSIYKISVGALHKVSLLYSQIQPRVRSIFKRLPKMMLLHRDVATVASRRLQTEGRQCPHTDKALFIVFSN